jgi:hypothetical protein
MELVGSRHQQLVFLNTHWGRKYSFRIPAQPGGQWTATARFGRREQLQAETAGVLLERVRHHYRSGTERPPIAGL